MALERFRQRIRQKAADRSAPPVLLVALGDSVTQGIGGIDELYHDQVYHAVVKRRLEAAHPLCTFSIINAGVDGHRVIDGAARLDRDVIRHQPDLVFLAFGLNDAALGRAANVPGFASALADHCQRVRAETSSDIVLITPNMMLTRANDAIPPRWRHVAQDFLTIQCSGLLGDYAAAIREVGGGLSIPVADVYAAWSRRAAEGIDTTADLANGLNHPNPRAHQLAADVIYSVLSADR
jgi:lysophospholipase L1-like esterase